MNGLSIKLTQIAISLMLAASLVLCNVARADLAIIVHPENQVQELSKRELSKIFLGRLRMFPSTDIETEVLDQSHEDSDFKNFYRKLLKMNPRKIRRYRASYLFTGQGRLPAELEDDKQVLEYVANNPSAIGYIDASLVDSSVRPVYTLKID